MAVPAGSKRKAAPAHLRIVGGRGTRKDGKPTDSGGRPVETGPKFYREAPSKPEGLSPDAEILWDLVIDQLTTVGLLKPLDGPSLEIACENYARWKEAVRWRQTHGLLGKNSQGVVAGTWIGIEERASREFRAWAAEFGFTPAAEQALAGEVAGGAATGADKNPF